MTAMAAEKRAYGNANRNGVHGTWHLEEAQCYNLCIHDKQTLISLKLV
jgi:hypothetical protein